MKRLLLFFALCFWLSGFSQPGSVDPTFNSDVSNFGIGVGGQVDKSALLAGDKIAIIGDFNAYNSFARHSLAILNADGSLDHAFDPDLASDDRVTAFFAQPDGKYLIAGKITYAGTQLIRVARLNADGSFDNSFEYGLSDGFNAGVECLTLLPDGKIIVGGVFSSYESSTTKGIVCLNSDGTLNAAFNSSGLGFNTGAQVFASQTQTDGKVILGGRFTTYNGANRTNILRINQDGSLDTGFTVGAGARGNKGSVNVTVLSIALQSTGKILIGGSFQYYNNALTRRIARLNTDGTKDTSFSFSSGSLGAQLQDGDVKNIRVLADDRVLLAGDIFRDPAYYLIRLSANGVVDTSFLPATNGVVSLIFTAVVQSDGKVVGYGVIEDVTTAYRSCRRFNTDGSVDLTFNPYNGTDGEILAIKALSSGRIAFGGGFYQYQEIPITGFAAIDSDGHLDPTFHIPTGINFVGWMAEQPNGKLLICGGFDGLDGHPEPGIARLNADGNVDTSFNSAVSTWGAPVAVQPDGKILLVNTISQLARVHSDGSQDSSFTNPFISSTISAIVPQTDGKTLISGTLDAGSGAIHLARLNNDGTIDTGFNIGSGPSTAVAVSVQSDGKILIAGNFTSFNGTPANRILRLNTDGTIDSSFNPGSGPNASVVQIVVQPNGKILLSGDFTSFNATTQHRIVRLLPNGSVDPGFDVGEGPFGSGWMSLQADGKIVVGGAFWRFDQTSAMFITRLLGDEPSDNSLEISGISPSAPFCAAQNGTVNFTANGTFDSGNNFSVQLSDASGNFASAVEIGSSAATVSGAIDVIIPPGTASGTGYKIRIKASSPEIVSEASESFEINAPTAWYADADGDGFGDATTAILACAQPDNHTADNSDCDDASATVHPGASEIPYNGIDEDCNGVIDNGSQIFSQILPSKCGTTLPALSTTIAAVSFGLPVNGYRFKVVNNATLSQQTIDRNVPNFQLTQLASYDYATTYTISVMLRRNGVWLNYYGPACQVSTPPILDPGQAGAINPSQCGTVLPSISTLIATTSLPGVTQYRFRVTNMTDPAGPNAVQTIDRSLHWFSLTMLARYNYGTEYKIEVAFKTNGAFSDYGAACNLFSPPVPTLSNCGATIASAGTIVSTTSLLNVTSYRFEVTNLSSGNFETTLIDRSLNWFTFHFVPDFQLSAQYGVRVALKTSGTWSPFGESCTITAPGAAKMSDVKNEIAAVSDFDVSVFPNPYSTVFGIRLASSRNSPVSILIYDMTGKLVSSDSIGANNLDNFAFGQNLASGVYNIVIRQGERFDTRRVIKR